jgi:hypothetical protein
MCSSEGYKVVHYDSKEKVKIAEDTGKSKAKFNLRNQG